MVNWVRCNYSRKRCLPSFQYNFTGELNTQNGFTWSDRCTLWVIIYSFIVVFTQLSFTLQLFRQTYCTQILEPTSAFNLFINTTPQLALACINRQSKTFRLTIKATKCIIILVTQFMQQSVQNINLYTSDIARKN